MAARHPGPADKPCGMVDGGCIADWDCFGTSGIEYVSSSLPAVLGCVYASSPKHGFGWVSASYPKHPLGGCKRTSFVAGRQTCSSGIGGTFGQGMIDDGFAGDGIGGIFGPGMVDDNSERGSPYSQADRTFEVAEYRG